MERLENSGARTSDWLAHQTKGGALYAYELPHTEQLGGVSSRQNIEDALRKVSRRGASAVRPVRPISRRPPTAGAAR